MRRRYRKSNLSHLPEYRVWDELQRRCLNPRHQNFSSYGGRGITVCARWDSFENFYADMGPRPSPAHSIDRIDNNRGYYPSNCQWATAAEQNRNRRDNSWVIFLGKRIILRDAARLLGVSKSALYMRVNRGMTPQQAVDTPIKKRASS